MKKALWIIAIVVFFSCEGGNRSQNKETATSPNVGEDVEENSGDNVSPQLEDSAARLNVDTVSSASGVEKQKEEGDLDKQ